MPNMSGREVFQRLREKLPELPVILMSGYADSQDAREMQRNGAAGFLRKPVSPDDILRAIDSAFAGGHWGTVTPMPAAPTKDR